MHLRKLVGLLVTLSLLLGTGAVFAGGKQEAAAAVNLEFVADQPEFEAQTRELWDVYVEKNPNVKVKVISVNEDQMAAFTARVAAGDAPHLGSAPTNKSNYKTYINLLDIDFQHWDKLSFDGKKIYEERWGVKGFVPAVQMFATFKYSFIYYDDEMKKTGIDFTKIRSWNDVDATMAKLKSYVDSTKGLEYVLDTGWHSWVWMTCLMPIMSLSLGQDLQKHRDLYLGKIDWTDLSKNPIVPVMEKLNDYTARGYLPKKWWTRGWENEYEAGFINRKSILTLHGPWMWTKTLAANPGAKLKGAPLPAGPGGKLAAFPTDDQFGTVIWGKWRSTPVMQDVVKAYNWWLSPEIAEMQAQFLGCPPSLKKLSSGFELNFSQFKEMVQPSLQGVWGDVTWVNESWGPQAAGPYLIEGKPSVMDDNIVVGELEKYLERRISAADLMGYFKKRWEAAYKF